MNGKEVTLIMNISEFSRLCYFEYYTDDMLRGTIYYGRRKDIDKTYLSKKPVYRVFKILKKEFMAQGYEAEFKEFEAWLNNSFTDQDRLHGAVQYFEKMYGTDIDAKHYLLPVKNACDVYIETML